MDSPLNPKGKKQKESNTKTLTEKNSNEDIKNTQFYLITLEDSNGEHQQIRIFRNSDAAEIAFNFCKENNLDYKSMKYIKKNIQKIIEGFDEPNHKLFFLDNSYSSIQEVDEENLVSENTLIDNEINKEKNGNKNRIKEIKFNNFNNNDNDKDREKKFNFINNIFDDNYNIKPEKDNEINNNQIYLEENKESEIDEINNNIDNNINNGMKYKNKNLNIPENNIELTIKSNNKQNNKEKKNDISNKDELNFIITEHFNTDNLNYEKHINQVRYLNTCKNQREKRQELNLFNNIQREDKSKNYLKFDFNSIKAKMKNIKIKNSVLNVKKRSNKENINYDKKTYTSNNILNNNIENNNNMNINNMNNSNLMKQPLFIDKNINYKKNEIINENILLDKYIKNVNKIQNSKIKSNNLNNSKKEEKIKPNKTPTKSNKSNIKNNKKENLLQKSKRYNNTIFFHKPNILNTDITQSKSIKEYDINNSFKSKEKQYNHSTRLTPKKTNIFIHKKENSNPKSIFKAKKEKIVKLRNTLQTNKERFSKILSNIFTQNFNQSNINKIVQNCYNQIQDKTSKLKNIIKNKIRKRKNSCMLQEHSFELFKSNDTSRSNLDKPMKRMETETNNNRSKKIFEMRKGLNKVFNNFFEHKNNNNILNTNYIINKRCRIINNKKKKSMSMSLTRHSSNNKKQYKSKKNSLELNITNTYFNNTHDILKEKEYRRPLTNKNSGVIYSNNKKKEINIINNNKNKEKNNYFNSPNQLMINNYNTNIKNYHVLNTINSYQTRKSIIEVKNKARNTTSSQKKFNKNGILNNSDSYSLLINNEKSKGNNDYSLNVLDQYYTINNTINITNNNSLMDNYQNKEKYKQDDKAFSLIKKIYKLLDKDNIGIIILNLKQKLNDIFLYNNLILNREQEKLLEKMFEVLFEIQKKNNNNFELDEYKVLINEKSFLKNMKQIYMNKLNSNERNMFLSIDNNNSDLTKKQIILDKIKQKHFLNKFKNT